MMRRQSMRDAEIEALLLMVDKSAKQFAPDESDFVQEYAIAVRNSKGLPVQNDNGQDDTTSPFLETHILIGIGLTLLGKIAFEFLDWLIAKAVDHGATTLWDYLNGVNSPGVIAKDATNVITVRLVLPEGV